MSIGEVNRKVESYVRVHDRQTKEKAAFDWQLANIIGISIGRRLSNEVQMPKLEEAYSGIFEEENKKLKEEKAKQEQDVNVLRFMQFASKHNLTFKAKEGGGETDS